MLISVSFGTALASSVLTLSMDISNKVARELRSFGANIVVEPKRMKLQDISEQRTFIHEEDIVKIKTIFWRYNIVGILPVLYVRDNITGRTVMGTWYENSLKVPGQDAPFVTGIKTVMGGWQLEGRWPESDNEIVAGYRTNLAVGDRVSLFGRPMEVVGILRTGTKEDDMFITELSTLQALTGLKGKVSRIFISALTTPMDDFAYRDPKTMSRTEYEKWYCTAYVTSIAKQIEEVVRGSTARPIWPIAQSEGKVMKKLKILVYLITAISLLGAALGVSTTMVMSLLGRTEEVALMKAIGADRLRIIVIFMTESLIIGLLGGGLGYLLSLPLSNYIGLKVFGSMLQQKSLLLPFALFSSVVIAVLGSYIPVRKALNISPAVVLKGL